MDIVLKIDGVHCGGCVAAVSKVLSSVPAVSAVEVNLDQGRATVEAGAGVKRERLVSAMLSPVLAGAAMAFSSVSVVANSALLARWKPHLSRSA